MMNVPSSFPSSIPDAATSAPVNPNGTLFLSPISSDPPLSRSLFDGPTTGVGVAMRTLDRPDGEEKVVTARQPQPPPSSNNNNMVLDPSLVSALAVGITQGMRDLFVDQLKSMRDLFNELKLAPSARSDGVSSSAPSDNDVRARRMCRNSESGMSAPTTKSHRNYNNKKKISFVAEQKARIRISSHSKSIKGALSIVKDALKSVNKSFKKADKYRSSLVSGRTKSLKKIS